MRPPGMHSPVRAVTGVLTVPGEAARRFSATDNSGPASATSPGGGTKAIIRLPGLAARSERRKSCGGRCLRSDDGDRWHVTFQLRVDDDGQGHDIHDRVVASGAATGPGRLSDATCHWITALAQEEPQNPPDNRPYGRP
jgi:hypothetical protein